MTEKVKQDASTPSSLNSTRDLLDELDALMEKMLSVPVDDAPAQPVTHDTRTTAVATEEVEDNPAPVVEHEGDPFAKLKQKKAVDTNESENDEDNETNYQYEEDNDAVDDWSGFHVTNEETRANDLIDDDADLESLQPSAMTEEIISSLKSQPEVKATEVLVGGERLLKGQTGLHWALWPLSAINRLFDSATYLLGPLGHYLRQPGGRTLLGLIGLALALGAVTVQIILWLTWN